jgi:hypothetical protein
LRIRTTFGLLTTMILISCADKETPFKEVVVHGTKENYRELELKVNRKGQGWSIHNFTWDTYDINDSYWIYVRRINGRVPGKNIAISVQRNSMYIDKNDRGYIDFDSLTMTINLEKAAYKDGVTLDHWEPFEFNETYKLKFSNDTIK